MKKMRENIVYKFFLELLFLVGAVLEVFLITMVYIAGVNGMYTGEYDGEEYIYNGIIGDRTSTVDTDFSAYFYDMTDNGDSVMSVVNFTKYAESYMKNLVTDDNLQVEIYVKDYGYSYDEYGAQGSAVKTEQCLYSNMNTQEGAYESVIYYDISPLYTWSATRYFDTMSEMVSYENSVEQQDYFIYYDNCSVYNEEDDTWGSYDYESGRFKLQIYYQCYRTYEIMLSTKVIHAYPGEYYDQEYRNNYPTLMAHVDSMEYISSNKVEIAVLAVIIAVVLLIILVLSLISAGHVKNHEGIYLTLFDRLPWEINLAGLVLAAVAMATTVYSVFMDNIIDIYVGNTSYVYINNIIYEAVYAVGIGCILLLMQILLKSAVAKCKARCGKESFMLWRIGRKLFGKESKFNKLCKYLNENISLVWKAVIFYIILTVFEIFILAIIVYCNMSVLIGFYIIAKILVTVCYMVFVIQVYKLYEGGKTLSEGKFDSEIDTRYMFWGFKRHGEHLNNINQGLQVAVEERMKSERMKTELITNVSHDIKTPLTSIINYVDLLQKENIDKEPEAEYIKVLSRQSARLKKLIEDLVEASKASSGAVKVEMTEMDANMIVGQASAEYSDKLTEKNISMLLQETPEPVMIRADGRHLWRVIDNLLNNAYKYAMPGTRLYINLETDSERNKVSIIFKNISKEPLNVSSTELMERFVRGDQSRNTEGSGLGLSIARSLCQLMKADFNVEIDGDLYKAIVTFDICE
jgi:two-component sensor histidine kinase